MIPRLSLLTPEARDRLHAQSLDLLERVGIRYDSRRALDLLGAAGCPVDYAARTARIPAAVVERCLEAVPREFQLASRNGRHDLAYAEGAPFRLILSSQGQRAIDLDTGLERDSTAEDLRRAARLADALDEVDIVAEIVNANDRDPATAPGFNRADLFASTSKHLRLMPESPAESRALLEMGAAVLGSAEALAARPIFSGMVCAVSPLGHHGPVVDAGLILAEAGLPLLIYTLPMAGATGPITLAGLALLNNVEILSLLVLYQIARPGLPMIYGAGASYIDLRTGLYRGTTPESDLVGLALGDLAHGYGLPVNGGSMSSGARHLGLEASAEAGRSSMVGCLAGYDELYGIGLLDAAQTLSLEKLFMDAEIARCLRRVAAGAPVTDLSLMTEVIRRVGFHGTFLAQPETRDTLRAHPPVSLKVGFADSYDAWRTAGVLEYDQAAQQAREILASHRPDPLPEAIVEELHRIAAACVP